MTSPPIPLHVPPTFPFPSHLTSPLVNPNLPAAPTFNSSNPFLNSTDNVRESTGAGTSEGDGMGEGEGQGSSVPHPLKIKAAAFRINGKRKSVEGQGGGEGEMGGDDVKEEERKRGVKRARTELDSEGVENRDAVPQTHPAYPSPPHRKPNKRIIDLTPRLEADFGVGASHVHRHTHAQGQTQARDAEEEGEGVEVEVEEEQDPLDTEGQSREDLGSDEDAEADGEGDGEEDDEQDPNPDSPEDGLEAGAGAGGDEGRGGGGVRVKQEEFEEAGVGNGYGGYEEEEEGESDDEEMTYDINPSSPTAPGHLIQQIPSSELYDQHMYVRSFDERLDVKGDIRRLNEAVPGLGREYRIVDRLGEGTFSSVYKAIDNYSFAISNTYWRSSLHLSAYKNVHTTSTLRPSATFHSNTLTDLNIDDMAWEEFVCQNEEGVMEGRVRPRLNYVALKRIYVTSSPDRISNELEIMEDLRGCRNTAQLITAFRLDDQVIAVMPFHRSDDFRLIYKYLDISSIRLYFRCLFRALHDVHQRGVIHRDVKPANFLWDFKTGEGVLVDFGLAERYETPSKTHCQHSAATLTKPHGEKIKTPTTAKVEQAVYEARTRAVTGRLGVPVVDNRPSIRANRAGTRGFRAPEVLLKCPDQNFAIDIWAAGIMLLSILCHKFPIFNSNDDSEALMEIAAVFGRSGLEKVASMHSRTLSLSVPVISENPQKSLHDLVLSLNPNLYTPPCSDVLPAEAKRHIDSVEAMLDLLRRCLALDPTKRWTAGQLLRHKFLEDGLEDDEKESTRGDSLELQEIGEGVCGHLHSMRNGQHIANIDGVEKVCGWGLGRAYGNEPCHYHLPNQKRPTIWDDDVEEPRSDMDVDLD